MNAVIILVGYILPVIVVFWLAPKVMIRRTRHGWKVGMVLMAICPFFNWVFALGFFADWLRGEAIY